MSDFPKGPPGPPPMPSSTLTGLQREKINTWFQTKTKANHLGAACPMCGTRNWTVLDDLIAPPTFHRGSMVIGGPAYPHFGLMCTNCGNTQFINAIASGILDPNGSGE